MTETSTETSKVDLSHLANLKPIETEFRATRRGRAPGSNPMDVHVRAAFDSGKTLALPITAGVAKGAERQARRAGVRMGYKMSIQVLTESPDKATADHVTPLAEVEKLPPETDVWLVLKAEPKPVKEDKPADAASGTESDADNADPFKGQPESADNDKTADTPKVNKGGRKVPAVANP